MENKSVFSFVVVGKSGVGKSSLINYFFNKEVAKTGAGAPVTDKAFDLFTNEEREITYKIYDSWGVENGKTEEWLAFLNSFLKERKGKDLTKWINTSIYCISAETNRIEEYDKKIIQALKKEELSPIIAITKFDTDQSNTFYNHVKATFPDLDVVGITSVNHVVGLGSNKKTIHKTGVQDLKEAVFRNSLKTYKARFDVVMSVIKKELKEKAPVDLEFKINDIVERSNTNLLDNISKQELERIGEILTKEIIQYNERMYAEVLQVYKKAVVTFSRFMEQSDTFDYNEKLKENKLDEGEVNFIKSFVVDAVLNQLDPFKSIFKLNTLGTLSAFSTFILLAPGNFLFLKINEYIGKSKSNVKKMLQKRIVDYYQSR